MYVRDLIMSYKSPKLYVLSFFKHKREIDYKMPSWLLFKGNTYEVSLTIDHSLALWPKVLMLTLSAYKAPINAPMLVPPTISTGISASTKAFSIPTCDRPLNNKNVDYMCKYMYMKN